jgi:(p)ppGpp synthase/HD superfamily hydrolase
MLRKRVGFDEIYDVSAVRVLVDTIPNCYAVLGIVHSLWTPISGEFDDYIAKPKPNGYQSLHTAIVGPGGRSLEVQIRTQEMHTFGEYGVAAHWAYKESRKAGKQADAKFNWLRQLMDWQKEVVDPRDIVASLKTDIFQDQVYVFTPGGDVFDLPLGATPVDFAYRVHTNVGHRTRGALVNGQIVPLDHKLATGDPRRDLDPQEGAAERATGSIPSSDMWSPRARARRSGSGFACRAARRRSCRASESLERELRRLGIDRPRFEDYVALVPKISNVDDLLAAIGFGDIATASVATKVLDAERAPRHRRGRGRGRPPGRAGAGARAQEGPRIAPGRGRRRRQHRRRRRRAQPPGPLLHARCPAIT